MTNEQKAQARENIGTNWLKTTQEALVSEAVSAGTNGYVIDPALNLAVGDNVTVIFDGVEYSCTVTENNGYLGFGDLIEDAYPFAYVNPQGGTGIFITRDTEPKTFSIIKNTQAIDTKYLPIVDFDRLGFTACVLEQFNAGGGTSYLGDASPGCAEPFCKAFPLSNAYVARLTIPGMGTMYVSPVYTLFDEGGFRAAHFDSYLAQGLKLTKFFVRTYRASISGGGEWFCIEVGFYT